MNETLILIIILTGFILLGFGIFYFVRRYFLTQKNTLDNINQQMISQLNEVVSQVNSRLRENLEMMQRQSKEFNLRLDGTHKVVRSVTNKLASLEEASKRIFDVGKDISSLQEILRAPKLRGGLGEYFLSDLLEQILPRENYVLQYNFRDGEKVDAVIKLRKMLIPVDSKFPLENFRIVLKAKTKEQKIRAKKQFLRDVKKHIETISQKYIRPTEGTSDFALMYIPAENVYYEIILKEKGVENISNFALSKKVIPVSPNSFYAYLQAILIGPRGMQIEKGAKRILEGLTQLQREFRKFGEDFRILGKHLMHARSAYESSERKLDRLSDHLLQIEKPHPERKLTLPFKKKKESE